jgi:MFS family permease
MIVCSLVTCVVTFTWLGIHSTSGIITIAAMYGFASGGLVALPPATIASLSKNPDENGTRVGMAFTVCSFGTLVGNPIAGALLPSWRNGTQRFARPWLFAGGIMLIAAALMLLTYLWTRDDETDESDWPESRRTSVVYQSILDSQIATEKARLIDCDEN